MLHILDLLRVLADDPGMSAPEEERDLGQVMERVVSYDGQARFDAVLGWNLFDYLDEPVIRALMRRVSEYCRSGTLLYIMTSNRDTIPDDPARVIIMDEQHLRLEHTGIGTRDCLKYMPGGLERMMRSFRLQHSHMLGNGLQDYIFTHV